MLWDGISNLVGRSKRKSGIDAIVFCEEWRHHFLTATTAFGVIVVTSNMHDFAYDVPELFF